ncbi:Oligopeptide transporter 2 [Yarrowia sp. B02]|nr:Oligopeptide transporter 2 [Yarrowia sp. B02]
MIDSKTEKDIGPDIAATEVTDINFVDYVAEKLNFVPGEDGQHFKNVRMMASFAAEMSEAEAIEILLKFIPVHEDDYNLRLEQKEYLKSLVEGEKAAPNPETYSMDLRIEAAAIKYWSPYIEVRAVTDCWDDMDEPCETIRSYAIGLIWLLVGTFVNQFFVFRFPPITISSDVLQLLTYPCGVFLSKVLPDWGVTIRGTRISLNPGPWTQKEQMCATFFLSSADSSTYVSAYNLPTQLLPMYYDQKWATFGYQIMLTLSSQFIGFGFAGILRRFAIYPTKAMWPLNMPTIALNRALLNPERKQNINGWTITKYWFFLVVFVGAFVYFWFPSYIFGALSNFNWMTWIAPDNVNLALITGFNGMAINPIPTFDWTYIGAGSVVTPWWSIVNNLIGVLIGTFCILGVYYSNVRWTAYLPMNQPGIYDNQGNSYHVTKILTNGVFDKAKYEKYGPPFWSAANLVSYGSFFCVYTLGFVYTMLAYWKDMHTAAVDFYHGIAFWKGRKKSEVDSAFARQLKKYPDVPDWWFFVVLLIAVGFTIATVKAWPTTTPVWGIFFVLGINLVFLVPICLLQAYTGNGFALNVLIEIILGYAINGRPTALNILKACGVNVDYVSQGFVSVWKTGMYAYVPSRAIFRTQMLGTLINAFVTVGILQYQLGLDDICTPEARKTTKFTCPGQNTFYAASVLFGAMGSERFFGSSKTPGLYPFLKWCFLIGAVIGLIFFAVQYTIPQYIAKKYPERKQQMLRLSERLGKFNPVVMNMGIIGAFPQGNLAYTVGGVYLAAAWLFIKKRYTEWWAKYTYVGVAGINVGNALAAIVIFFALQYTNVNLDWWGNDVSYAGQDGANGNQGPILKSLAPGEVFGPQPGHFP